MQSPSPSEPISPLLLLPARAGRTLRECVFCSTSKRNCAWRMAAVSAGWEGSATKPRCWLREPKCCSKTRVRCCSVGVSSVSVLEPSRTRSPTGNGEQGGPVSAVAGRASPLSERPPLTCVLQQPRQAAHQWLRRRRRHPRRGGQRGRPSGGERNPARLASPRARRRSTARRTSALPQRRAAPPRLERRHLHPVAMEPAPASPSRPAGPAPPAPPPSPPPGGARPHRRWEGGAATPPRGPTCKRGRHKGAAGRGAPCAGPAGGRGRSAARPPPARHGAVRRGTGRAERSGERLS